MSGKSSLTLRAHKDKVYALSFHPDGSMVASGSGDQTAIIWDLRRGTVAYRLRTRAGPVTSVTFSPNANFLATGGAERVIVWQVPGGQQSRKLPQKRAECLSFSPDSRNLLVGTSDGKLSLWDLDSATCFQTLALSGRPILSLHFAPDGRTLAVASGEGVVVFIETETWSPLRSIRLASDKQSIVYQWIFAPDNRLHAGSLHILQGGPIGSDSIPDRYEIVLWNCIADKEPDLERTLLGHASWIGGLDFAPSGALLASGAFDESVRLWDVSNKKLLGESREHEGAVYQVAFSPSGNILATCSADRSVKLWQVEDLIRCDRPSRSPDFAIQPVQRLSNTLVSGMSSPGRAGLVRVAQDFLDGLMGLSTTVAIEKACVELYQTFSDLATLIFNGVEHILKLRLEQARREGSWEEAHLYRTVAFSITRVTSSHASLRANLTKHERQNAVTELLSLAMQADKVEDDYRSTGKTEVLDGAVTLWEQGLQHPALKSLPAQDQLAIRNNAAGVYLLRYQAEGAVADLDRAITQLEQVVVEGIPDSPQLAMHRSNLGSALKVRYEREGNIADLNRAIDIFEKSVSETAVDTVDSAQRLLSLGAGLAVRFNRGGNIADLDRAICIFERAASVLLEGTEGWAMCLSNLGQALVQRSRAGLMSANIADLDRAIQILERVVALTPSDSYGFPKYLDSLARCLRERCDSRYGIASSRHLEDIDNAIEIQQLALDKAPADSPELPGYLDNLGCILLDRYRITGSLADVDRAIEAIRRGVDLAPNDSARLPNILNDLGNCLARRYERSGDWSDLEQGIEAYRKCCQIASKIYPEMTVIAGSSWGGWAVDRGCWEEAAAAYDFAFDAMLDLFRVQLLRGHKEAWLRVCHAIPAHAAYALAKANEPERAVLTLDRGLALLLSNALERHRQDLESLNDFGQSDLLQRYRDATNRLATLEQTALAYDPNGSIWSQSPTGGGSTQSSDHFAEDLRAGHEVLNAIVADIRKVDGFAEFLGTTKFDDIRMAAADNPLVYIAATRVGGLSLIVRLNGDCCVKAIFLPDLTESNLIDNVGNYLRAYNAQEANPVAWRAALEHITGWLWDGAMGPLARVLAAVPRATLIPAGLLALLPLHAAWTPDPSSPSERRYVLDSITLSFAPNARALREALTVAARTPADTLLAVSDPRPVSKNPLPNSDVELETAISAFSRCRVLRHQDAKRKNVLAALPEYSVLHFACHGTANLNEPLASGLVMAEDQLLSLRDFLTLGLPGVRLAVLSACDTGVIGMKVPNEVVNLPTALMQAGVPGVIASLWSVPDLSTAILMSRFYELWRGEEVLAPVHALREAQLWLRNVTARELTEWFAAREKARLAIGEPTDVVGEQFLYFAASDLDDRPFAELHYWAPFTISGL